MRFRRLGRTELRVSEISLGTVEIGLDYGIAENGPRRRPEEAEAARLLHRAIDLGINFIDTARAYGESEAIIGRTLKHRRSEIILCSKVASYSGQHFSSATLKHKLTTSVDASLAALNTDRIDILMIHSAPAEVIEAGEVAGILEDLRQQGKFLWIGASVYGEEAALAAMRAGKYDCLQVACSALDRRPEESVWPEARNIDVGIVARSVLLKGALTTRYRHLPESLDGLKEAVARLEHLAGGARISLPELAYRYVLSSNPPHTALVGASSVNELESAVRFADAGPLPGEIIACIREIDVANENDLNPGTWGLG